MAVSAHPVSQHQQTGIHIAGNGGIKTEVAEFLCKVNTDEEVMEYSGAFLQLYREEGYYLERTVHYLARVGMAHVRQCVLEDDAQRQALAARLFDALGTEADPWQQPDPREFTPITWQGASA